MTPAPAITAAPPAADTAAGNYGVTAFDAYVGGVVEGPQYRDKYDSARRLGFAMAFGFGRRVEVVRVATGEVVGVYLKGQWVPTFGVAQGDE